MKSSKGKESHVDSKSKTKEPTVTTQVESGPVVSEPLPVSGPLSFPPVDYPPNGIIRLYDQFPRRYRGGLPEMINDLPRIRQMGFNVVWLNPIQLSGGKKKVGPFNDKKEVHGSLYAMIDDEQFNPDFFPGIKDHAERVKVVQQFTSTARSLGLIPIFDLVINHVGDDPGLKDKFKKFLKPKEENPEENIWEDTIPFNYDDPNINVHIIREIWQPFITKYINTYGFLGARVDAIVNIGRRINPNLDKQLRNQPDNMDYTIQQQVYALLKQCCQQQNTQPIILGELMAADPLKYIDKFKTLGFTHIFSAGAFYWNIFFDYARKEMYWLSSEAQLGIPPEWLDAQVNRLQEIVCPTDQPPGFGGVAGFVGNHDVGTLRGIAIFHYESGINYGGTWQPAHPLDARKDKTKILKFMEAKDFYKYEGFKNKTDYTEQMSQKILEVALTCNGGWYMLAGDEYGIGHRPMVFSEYQAKRSFTDENPDRANDLSGYIKNINYVLDQLPPTAQGDQTSHHYLKHDDLGIGIVMVIRTNPSAKNPIIVCTSEGEIKDMDILFQLTQKKLEELKVKGDIYFLNHASIYGCRNGEAMQKLDLSNWPEPIGHHHTALESPSTTTRSAPPISPYPLLTAGLFGHSSTTTSSPRSGVSGASTDVSGHEAVQDVSFLSYRAAQDCITRLQALGFNDREYEIKSAASNSKSKGEQSYVISLTKAEARALQTKIPMPRNR